VDYFGNRPERKAWRGFRDGVGLSLRNASQPRSRVLHTWQAARITAGRPAPGRYCVSV